MSGQVLQRPGKDNSKMPFVRYMLEHEVSSKVRITDLMYQVDPDPGVREAERLADPMDDIRRQAELDTGLSSSVDDPLKGSSFKERDDKIDREISQSEVFSQGADAVRESAFNIRSIRSFIEQTIEPLTDQGELTFNHESLPDLSEYAKSGEERVIDMVDRVADALATLFINHTSKIPNPPTSEGKLACDLIKYAIITGEPLFD